MSFVISVYVNEGIVIASDRRTTYNKSQDIEGKHIELLGVHTNDSTDKTFMCPNGAGISTCGEASFKGRPITGFIQDMIRTRIDAECDVRKIPQIIIDYFYENEKVPDSQFMIAGYDKDPEKSEQLIFMLNLKTKKVDQIDTANQGATWAGEGLTLMRLIQNVGIIGENGKVDPLPYEDISWNYFTLQDAVDFARYAVETTINTMHFKNTLETVGGDIDILIITKDETKWLQKKEIQ